MITRKDARPGISHTSNYVENQAGNIIDADSLYNNCVSGILNDSVPGILGRALRDRPANEDQIRGVV